MYWLKQLKDRTLKSIATAIGLQPGSSMWGTRLQYVKLISFMRKIIKTSRRMTPRIDSWEDYQDIYKANNWAKAHL